MLVLMLGILKPGSGAEATRLQWDFTEHLAQPLLDIRVAGRLNRPDGDEYGFMILLETQSLDAARAFFEGDPFFANGLYEQVHLTQFVPEVGGAGLRS